MIGPLIVAALAWPMLRERTSERGGDPLSRRAGHDPAGF
jgi:hypothetical protein